MRAVVLTIGFVLLATLAFGLLAGEFLDEFDTENEQD